MTTLIEDVQALLAPLVGDRVWYGVNTAEPPVYPYIVWQRVASNPNVSLGGPSDLQNTRIQVDIYSLRIAEAATIELAVEEVFASWSVKNVPLMSQDFYDPDVRAFRVMKDFSIWATN